MAWIAEIKKLLKRDFIYRLENQFETKNVEKILKWFEKKSLTTIRVNINKISIQDVMSILREKWCQFERASDLPYTLILKNKKENFVQELDLYDKWRIYMQNIASQLPPHFLNPKKWDKILDVSAAPWSKTTQISMLTNWDSEIIANDIDEIRVEKLKYNVKKQWFTNIEVLNKNWATLWWIYEWQFDKILLDAPCSAEWRINLNNPKTYKFWAEKNIAKNKKVQKQLFKSAFKALKNWWEMIYSTCTLAPEENEEIVTWALEKYEWELFLEKIWDENFRRNFEKNLIPVLKNFFPDWEKFLDSEKKFFPGIEKFCLKACPWEISEWFFIAKFKKK